MNTGIFIRAKVNDKWEAVDIGDSRLSNPEFLDWLRSKDSHYIESLVMALLGRRNQ